LYAAIAAGAPLPTFHGEQEYFRRDGSIMVGELQVVPQVDADGQVVQILGVTRDITAQRKFQDDLAESQRMYRLLAEHSSDLVLRQDLDGTLEWVSPSVVEVLGRQPELVVGRPVTAFVHPDDIDRHDARVAEAIANESPGTPVTVRVAHSSAGWRWMSVAARALREEDGRVFGVVEAWRDVHAEVSAQELLARSEQQFRMAMASAPIGMAVVDLDRRFVRVNAALCRMLGRTQEWLLARGVADVLAADAEADARDRRVRDELRAGERDSVTSDERMVTAQGEDLIVTHAIGLLRDDLGNPLWYVSQFVDITEARRAQEKLRFLATHDAMTSLANRAEVFDVLGRAVARHEADGAGARVGVLFIDLDDLKGVNDAYGHAVGDQVIMFVADRLRACVVGNDTAARIGGDEFVVVMPELPNPEAAEALAQAIRSELAIGVTTDAAVIVPTVSIGVACAEPGDSVKDLLARADRALYRAKEDGRNRIAT
jgi:diguanylate cyclase (GGDEF)-like protein/PAS domain S-box-containing protein